MDKYLEDNFNVHLRSQFNLLYELVLQSPINVTSIKDKNDFALKHILDSLYFFMKHPKKVKTVADIGSGGGFPGLVLGIFYPDWEITLIESVGKKCKFLESTAKKLSLSNVNIINLRAEMLSGLCFDLITARGVGTVKEVLRYTHAISSRNTAWLMYKGEKVDDELKEAKEDINKLRLKYETFRVETPFTRSYLYMHS